MKLVLIGYMGSGKSSIGKLLSIATNFPYQDLDTYIESSEGIDISEIFKNKGEIYFRKREAVLLEQVLSENKNMVLATGGGTPCYGNVMDDILATDKVISIYLNCSVDTLTNRLWDEKEKRPLIAHLKSKDDLNDFIRKHLFERTFYYNKAHLKINCDHLTEIEIVEKIVLNLF